MIDLVFLETTAAQQGADMGSMVGMIAMLVLFGVFFWLFIVRPQKKREKEMKEQLSKMSIGDQIITIGGLVGVLAHIGEDDVTIYTSAANTPVCFKKASIEKIIPRNSDKNSDKDGKSKK
ncbi:MAG: preprotein translocase subunit YajC [Clostridiales bacterium]|nr:preprotein translocase subunit YajC [Clostridiales bacterium]